jgi:hypothetical protein
MSIFGQQARTDINPANDEPINGGLVIFGDTESECQQIVTNKAK